MTDKITLNNVTTFTNDTSAVATVNNNNATIVTALDNTLSLDGTSPNQMKNSLDMNSNQIINLPNPSTVNSPLRLSDLNTFIGGGTISSIPIGGTTGQVLGKTSSVNYAVGWENSVTSVGLALPSEFTVTNSPVTTTGTLTGAWTNPPTGTGNIVKSNSPTLVSPVLGTPSSLTLSNATGLPLSTGVVGTLQAAQFPILTGDLTSAGGTLATTIVNNAVTNAKTAQMAAFTIKGNATGSATNPTDISIPALTNKASPVNADMILIADSAASNALKFTTLGSLPSSSGVTSIAGNSGAFTLTGGITNTTNAIKLALNNTTLQTSSINPTGTASTAGIVMMGLGSSFFITPTYSGRLKVEIVGATSNTTSTAINTIRLYFGTVGGGVPTNGQAVTGTQVGGGIQQTVPGVSFNCFFISPGIITGLTPGTAYWVDLGLIVSAGTGSVSCSCNIMEF